MYRTRAISSDLPGSLAFERIGALLAREGVAYVVSERSLVSTGTPVVLLGFQPKLYSHANWVGINPFAFVTGVDLSWEPGQGSATAITLRINQRRALLWVAFWVACSAMAATGLPRLWGSLLVVGVFCAAWLGIVSFLGSYLLTKEISDCLKSVPTQTS